MSEENFDRIPLVLRWKEERQVAETYGFSGSQGMTVLEGQLMRRRDSASRTVFIFMHPSSTLHLLPMPSAMAEAGLHVLCAASRYPKNDSALIVEKAALDMGAWVRWAREQGGYEKVVLVGWSGGGALSLFYQAEAESPSVTHTPAGDPVDFAAARLSPADGVIFIAAHLSRAETLTEWIDPSVLDEMDPDRRDPALDIYDPACPHKPPFGAEYVARFRAAQRARSDRITAWSREMLETLRRRGGVETERAFVVHRTMADPRWIDPTEAPNDRKANWCYLGDPRLVNVMPVGLGRYTSLRSWLSQWSIEASQATSRRNAPRVRRTPVLQIENTADDAVPATHNPQVHEWLGTPDKTLERIVGATHYYSGQPQLMQQCLGVARQWCEARRLLV
jgi:alpha/beta superfamily hydrolase